MTTCNGPGPDGARCPRPVRANGLCEAHRLQQRRGKPLAPIKPRRTGCSVDGCDMPHAARGYCSTHYKHWEQDKLGKTRRYTRKAAPKPCPGPGPNGTLCGRDVTGRGYCPAHCRQDRLGQRLTPVRMVGQAVVKARGGEIRNGSPRVTECAECGGGPIHGKGLCVNCYQRQWRATAPAKPRKPRPSRAKAKSTLPAGWFTPSKPTRSNPTSAPLDEDRIDVLLRPMPLTPETIQAARSKLIRWGAGDLLDMLGLEQAS